MTKTRSDEIEHSPVLPSLLLCAVVLTVLTGCAETELPPPRRLASPTAEAESPSDRAPPEPRYTIKPFTELTLSETAADSLGRIGDAAVPSLIEALEHPDPDKRGLAAATLAQIGPAAEQAVPQLVVALNDPDEDVRRMAARALGQIGPQAGEAVPALVEMMVQHEGTEAGATREPGASKQPANSD